MRCFIQAVALLLLFSPSVTAEYPPALINVRQVTGGLEEVRAQPPSIGYFLLLKNRGVPTQATEVRLGYDAANLYVIFRCSEASMDRLTANVTERDGPVWRDDSVEVILDPALDGRTFFHMVSNSSGVRYDSQGIEPQPDSWNGDWSVKVERHADSWEAEVTIPFSSLGVRPPKPGTVWNANFGRTRRVDLEMSSWSPVEGGFTEPRSFGNLVFRDGSGVILSTSALDVRAPGIYPLEISVSNPANLSIGAYMSICGKVEDFLPPEEATVGEMELGFDEGTYTFSLNFYSPGNYEIMRTPMIWTNMPPHGFRHDRYRDITYNLSPPPKLRPEVDAIRESLDTLYEAYWDGEGAGPEKWQRFGEALDELEPRLAEVYYASVDKGLRGYVLGAETSLTKVFRHRMFEGRLGGPVEVAAARNEFESAQAVIMAHGRELKDLSVSVSDLKGPDGALFPADRVQLNLVEYVKTRQPRYEVDYVGWWPDPLMDLAQFDVHKGGIQPVWITVNPGEDTPAGVYRGRIEIRPKNARPSSIPIEVRVWDFTLPTTPSLKTAFALFPHELGAWYGGFSDDMRRDWYDFLLQKRLNPTNIYSRTPMPSKEDLPFCVERGLNAFSLAYTHNKDAEGREELAAMIRECEAYLKEKGWWDKAYIYGFDEILRPKYHELRDMYGWVKSEFPDLPRMCTVIPNEDLKGFVDIWVPVTSNYVAEDAKAYTRDGDEVWWYVCCNPHHPYPNFFVDYPAIDPRIIFWMNWKYQVPGFLYHAVNLWTTNRSNQEVQREMRPHEDPEVREAIRKGKRWPEIPWNTFTFDDFNGDGHLIYPGPDGKPLSSIRLECIRDGIEDYEYHRLLADEVKRVRKADPSTLVSAAALLEDSYVVRSLTEYTRSPGVLLDARRQIAELIEELRKSD